MSLAPIAPTINLDLEIALGAKQQTQEWSSISTTKKLLSKREKNDGLTPKCWQALSEDLQVSAKTSEDDKRKKSGSQKKLANNATVYSWLKKRGKTVKKFIDIKTRKDLKEVSANDVCVLSNVVLICSSCFQMPWCGWWWYRGQTWDHGRFESAWN